MPDLTLEQTINLVRCEFCLAVPGESCRVMSGPRRGQIYMNGQPHGKRIRSASRHGLITKWYAEKDAEASDA